MKIHEHHHPNDGCFRPNCKRCKLEQAAPDLLTASKLLVDTTALNTIINLAKRQDDPSLEGYTIVLEVLLKNLKAAITKAELHE